jgi:hypothetical protein
MTIERKNDEIIIKISSSLDGRDLQDLLNLIRYKELTAKSKIKQATVNKLSRSINKSWWKKNAKRFVK